MKRSAFLTRYIRSQQPVYPKRHWLSELGLWMLGLWGSLTIIVIGCALGYWVSELIIQAFK